MSDLQKEILYTIQVEGQDDLLKELAELRQETSDLKRENLSYNRSLRKGIPMSEKVRKESEKNTLQIAKNSKRMRELSKAMQDNGKDTTTVTTKLGELTDELNRMNIAGQSGTKEFQDMRKEATALQNSVDRVNNEIAVFADDVLAMNVAADMATGVVSAFQGVASATALMGFESEKFEETLQKLVAMQSLVNSLQQIQNVLNAKGRVLIVGKAMATKGLIVVQTLWNKALATTLTLWNALGIGLIIAAIAGLVIGIRALVKNWDAVVESLKKAVRWLMFWKDTTEELITVQESYEEIQERLLEQSERYQTELGREIERLKAKGASVDEIIAKERELIEEEIKAAEIRLKLAFMESAALEKTAEERLEAQEAFFEATDALDELWHKLEVFDIREKKRQEENTEKTKEEIEKRREARQKEIDDELLHQMALERREKEAALRLAAMRENTYENQLALLTYLHERELEEQELTISEKLILEEEYNRRKEELLREYAEKEAEVVEEIEEEKKEIETFRREDQLRDIEEWHEKELEKLKEARELQYLTEEEYHRRVRELEDHTAMLKLDYYDMIMQRSFQMTGLLIDNLSKLAGNEEEFAGFRKALAIAESIWAVSVGLSRTLAAGFPQNIPLAIGFAAQTAGLLANIKAAVAPKKPSITAADGAFVGGKPHSMGGTKYYGDDGNVVEFERGEYLAIINKRDSQRAALLDGINREHGKPLLSNVSSGFHRWGGIELGRPRNGVGSEDTERLIRNVVSEIRSIPVVNVTRETFDVQRKVQNLERAGNL